MQNGIADGAIAVLYGDVFEISGTCTAATDDYVYYTIGLSNISTTIYPYYVVRYKTDASASGSGLGAICQVTRTDNPSWSLIDNVVTTSATPAFSTDWTVATGTLVAGHTLENLQFWAKEAADVTSGNYSVYFDFMLLAKGAFTFLNIAHGLEVRFPPRYATIPIPSMVGAQTQNLGSHLAEVKVGCDLDIGTWKRSSNPADYVDGEVFMDIAHNSNSEPWQWLDTGSEQFKVTLDDPVISRISSGSSTERRLDLLLREYRLGDAGNEEWYERFGLNL